MRLSATRTLDGLDAAVGETALARLARAPEDPDGSRDEELAGREPIAERLAEEVEWLRDCARWLAQLDLGTYPPVANLRPDADHPDRGNVIVDIGRVTRVLPSTSSPAPAASKSSTTPRSTRMLALNGAGGWQSPLAFPTRGTSIRQYRQASPPMFQSIGGTAPDAIDRVIYDTDLAALTFDPDGAVTPHPHHHS